MNNSLNSQKTTQEDLLANVLFAAMSEQGFYYRGHDNSHPKRANATFGTDDGEKITLDFIERGTKGFSVVVDNDGVAIYGNGSTMAAALFAFMNNLTEHRPSGRLYRVGVNAVHAGTAYLAANAMCH